MYHSAVVLSPRRRLLAVTASNAGSGMARFAARMALDTALAAVPVPVPVPAEAEVPAGGSAGAAAEGQAHASL
jgi:hypothetical protein